MSGDSAGMIMVLMSLVIMRRISVLAQGVDPFILIFVHHSVDLRYNHPRLERGHRAYERAQFYYR